MTFAVAVGAASKAATSADGATWTLRMLPFSNNTALAVAYGNGLWVATGVAGFLATSTDGITWTLRTSQFGTDNINDVAYGNGLWVTAGGSGKLATSADGVTWTQRTSPFGTTAIQTVACGNGLWVTAGTAGKLATSTDGVTWTSRTSSFGTSTIRAVRYGASLWVATGDAGKLATSTDGMAWTQRTSSFADNINDVAYGNSLWVAAGAGGKLATSPDGTNWTQRTSSFGTDDVFAIAYGTGRWIAAGTAGKLATSTDGMAWTQRTSSFGTSPINGVAATLNVAPNAPAWTTAQGQTVDVAADSVLSWAFSDPDPGDSQSQFVLDRWALDSGGARVGAAVRVVQSTPVTSYTVPGGSLVAGTEYEFKVATRDAQGVPALDADLVFSESLFRTFAAKPGAPTITAPASGATVNITATLSWSTPDQAAYQVQMLDGSGVLVPGTDTGEVADPTVRSLVLSFPTNNTTRTIRVRRKLGALWSEWAQVTVSVSWTAPADPTGVATPVPADGATDLTITNPAPSGGEPTVAYNDVYFAEPGGTEQRRATLVPPNSTWRHWLPVSDAVYTYRIVAVATNGTTAEGTVS